MQLISVSFLKKSKLYLTIFSFNIILQAQYVMANDYLIPSKSVVKSELSKQVNSQNFIHKIDLIEAMQKTIQHSYTLKAAQANVAVSDENRSAALRTIGPNLSTTASALWAENSKPDALQRPNRNQLTSYNTLTLSQPILGLIPIYHTFNQKDIALKINSNLKQQTELQAGASGATYYLNYELALQQLTIAQANLSTIKKSNTDAQSLYQTGSIYKDDYLRIVLEYSQSKQQVFQAQTQLDTARFSLIQAMGLDNLSTIQIADDSISYWEKNKPNLPTLFEAKKISLKNNYQILAAQENIDLAKINKQLAIDNYLPSVNAIVSYTHNFDNPTSSKNQISNTINDSVSYGFELSWNLWDWGVRQAQIGSATEQISSQQNQTSDLKEQILNQVVSQYNIIQNNINNVTVAKESVNTAQEAYDLVSYRFLNGQVSALDLITAQQSLTTAKADLAQTRFDLDLAWISFETLLGKNPTQI